MASSSKQISFTWKRWMSFGAVCCLMFNLSYFMATTVPACPECARGDASGSQVFHWLFMVIFALACVAMFIIATVQYFDEK